MPTNTVLVPREVLEPFRSFAERFVDAEGWNGHRAERERIVDWFGPSDFRALSQAIVAAPEGEGIRPEVRAFAVLMERELRANDHKPGWKQDEAEDLARRVEQEAGELSEAIRDLWKVKWAPADAASFEGPSGRLTRLNPSTRKPEVGVGYEEVTEPLRSERVAAAIKEAADVANMAMMVADVLVGLPALSSSAAPSSVEGGEGRLRELQTLASKAAAVVDLIEGFPGCGTLKNVEGIRLKDQERWVEFYNAVSPYRVSDTPASSSPVGQNG